MSKRTVLAWMDLETTGLDAENGRMLEYAVIFTDLELNELDAVTDIIPQNVGIARAMMGDYVTEMHTKNGLLEALEAVKTNAPLYADSMEQTDIKLANSFALVKNQDKDVVFVIAGSNVLFDVKWMMEHMPETLEYIDHRGVIDGPESYRCLDVSSYKVGFPALFKTSTSSAHRAMDDIRYSLGVQVRMKMIVDAGVTALSEQGVILGA